MAFDVAFRICIIHTALAEVASWTVDLKEARRFYYERNNEYNNYNARYNDVNINEDSYVPNYYGGVQYPTYPIDDGGGYAGGVNYPQMSHKKDWHNVDSNVKYADEYQYQSYMEKKVLNVVKNGTVYLEGLQRAIEQYIGTLENCTRYIRNNTGRIPSTQNSTIWTLPQINSQNVSDCERVTRTSELVRRLAQLALWATRELQDRAYRQEYQPYYKENNREDDELILKLALFLDRLANLTGYDPNTQEFVTSTPPPPVPSAVTPPPLLSLPIPPQVMQHMMTCLTGNSDEPATVRCGMPIPPILLEMFANAGNPPSLPLQPGAPSLPSVSSPPSVPLSPGIPSPSGGPSPSEIPPSPSGPLPPGVPSSPGILSLPGIQPPSSDPPNAGSSPSSGSGNQINPPGNQITDTATPNPGAWIPASWPANFTFPPGNFTPPPGFPNTGRANGTWTIPFGAGNATWPWGPWSNFTAPPNFGTYNGTWTPPLEGANTTLSDFIQLLRLRLGHANLSQSNNNWNNSAPSVNWTWTYPPGVFLPANNNTYPFPLNLTRVRSVRKRSTDDPLLKVAKYYVKHKIWENSNTSTRNDKQELHIDNNDVTASKSIQKRSVLRKKSTRLRHPKNLARVITDHIRQRISSDLLKKKHRLDEIKHVVRRIQDKVSRTFIRKLEHVKKVKRSVAYGNKYMPRVSENPKQDISYYVKNKAGRNYNPSLVQAAQSRLYLEQAFQTGNIEVMRRFGSNYNPANPAHVYMGALLTVIADV